MLATTVFEVRDTTHSFGKTYAAPVVWYVGFFSSMSTMERWYN